MRQKILIAEDDPSIQKMFILILEKAGYDVEITADGNTVYNLDTNQPNLFILDKQLGSMNGLDMCRYLKTNTTTCDIPVIMVSAVPGILTLAKEAGAEEALEKPFSINILLEKIRKCLAGSDIPKA